MLCTSCGAEAAAADVVCRVCGSGQGLAIIADDSAGATSVAKRAPEVLPRRSDGVDESRDPVAFAVAVSGAFMPALVALRVVIVAATLLLLARLPWPLWFWTLVGLYVALPVIAAAQVATTGSATYLSRAEHGPTAWIRCVMGCASFMALATDRAPLRRPTRSGVTLRVRPVGSPSTRSAILRAGAAAPFAATLGLLGPGLVAMWLVSGASIALRRARPGWAAAFVESYLDSVAHLLVYMASLVDRYPPLPLPLRDARPEAERVIASLEGVSVVRGTDALIALFPEGYVVAHRTTIERAIAGLFSIGSFAISIISKAPGLGLLGLSEFGIRGIEHRVLSQFELRNVRKVAGAGNPTLKTVAERWGAAPTSWEDVARVTVAMRADRLDVNIRRNLPADGGRPVTKNDRVSGIEGVHIKDALDALESIVASKIAVEGRRAQFDRDRDRIANAGAGGYRQRLVDLGFFRATPGGGGRNDRIVSASNLPDVAFDGSQKAVFAVEGRGRLQGVVTFRRPLLRSVGWRGERGEANALTRDVELNRLLAGEVREARIKGIRVYQIGDTAYIEVESAFLPTRRLLDAVERIAGHAARVPALRDLPAGVAGDGSDAGSAELPRWWSGLPRRESSLVVGAVLALLLVLVPGVFFGGGARRGGYLLLSVMTLPVMWGAVAIVMGVVGRFRRD